MCELGRPGCNRDRAEVSPPSHNALRVVRCFGPLSGGFEKRKILKFYRPHRCFKRIPAFRSASQRTGNSEDSSMQGRPELTNLPRFRSASRRTRNRKTLHMQGRRPKSLPKFRPAVRQNGTSGVGSGNSWLKRKAAPPQLRIGRLLGPLPGGPAVLQNLKTRGRPSFRESSEQFGPPSGDRRTGDSEIARSQPFFKSVPTCRSAIGRT